MTERRITSSHLKRSSFLRAVAAGAFALSIVGLFGCKSGGGDGAASSSGGGAGGDEIVVGEYASMTGDTSTFGTQSHAGVEFAIKEINDAGGIDVGGTKKKVRLVSEDDRSLPEEAKTIATKFSDDKSIVAVIGEVASTRSKTAAPVYQRAGIPMISPSSTAEDVTKIGDYIFRVCFIDPFQGFVMAKFAREDLKASKVAVMRSQKSDYSVGLADVFKKEFTAMGGTVPVDVSYNDTDSDFRSQLAQVKAANPDAIFIPGYYGEVGTIARQAREQEINVPLLGGDGWDSDKLVEGAGGPGKALENCYFSTHYSTEDKTPRVQEFVQKFKQQNGSEPAALVAQGYDAMMILADAIKRAGSTDRAKVRDALAQTKDYPAITGMITLDENRNANKSAVVLQIVGDKFVFKQTIEPRK